MANDTGANQVYVSSLTGERGRVQVSVHGGSGSVWSPDGRRLYFRGPTGEPNAFGMHWSEITTIPRLSATKPRLMFRSERFSSQLDLSPDGKRFAMVMFDNSPLPHTLRMIQNWRGLQSATSRE
jgi:Tol biopolymer transport system component